jgi:hypothetical protein
VYTHRRLSIGYNGPNIIEVNMTSENLAPLEEGGWVTVEMDGCV